HAASDSSAHSAWRASVGGVARTGARARHRDEAPILELLYHGERAVVILLDREVPIERVRRPVGSAGTRVGRHARIWSVVLCPRLRGAGSGAHGVVVAVVVEVRAHVVVEDLVARRRDGHLASGEVVSWGPPCVPAQTGIVLASLPTGQTPPRHGPAHPSHREP